MHYNKRSSDGGSSNSQNFLSSASSLSSSTSLHLSSASASSAPSPTASYAPKTTHGPSLGLWCFLLLALVVMAQQQPCECRYLPTRSHGDDLDKLRELMLQILESSNEDQRPPNEANGNTLAAHRANWLNKLSGGGGGGSNGMDAMETPRKYAAPHGLYDNGRYY